MIFTPNTTETNFLSQIIRCYNGEYSLLRFTSTMLEKSIIDAGENFRCLLKENDLIDYSNIIPGKDKIILEAKLITDKVHDISISFYRPKTKKGDPRFWIYGFKKIVRCGEMIYITIYKNQIYIIPLVDSFFNYDLISSIFSNNTSIEATECINIIKTFLNKDILSVSPTKLNPKDIGDTLERELHISPNSSKIADYKNKVELKAKRKGTKTRDTLFSMVPNWQQSNIQSSPEMILTYGYESRKYEDFMDLYVTVSNTPNNQGLYLEIDEENQIVIQKYKDANGDIFDTCIWNFSDLKQRLCSKHPETLWVIGDTIQKDNNYYFRYESIEHTSTPIFSSFLLLISEGIITYDWRGRVKKDGTQYKDKGHCFRLKPSYRDMLFGSTEKLDL